MQNRVGKNNIPRMGKDSEKTDVADLIAAVGDQPGFDADAAKKVADDLNDRDPVTRNDAMNILCAGLGISGNGCTPKALEVRGITVGQDRHPPGGCQGDDNLGNGNCYNSDGILSNDQLVTFISRTLGSLGDGPGDTPPPQVCPSGWSGTYPNCVAPPQTCPTGWTGTYPNCQAPRVNPPRECPTGWTGTPPRCTPPVTECPTGWTGTYPNCVAPPPPCPAGSTRMTEHVDPVTSDDGCRPTDCSPPLVRQADGWCDHPPVSGDQPVLSVSGGGDVDENGGTVGFRVEASHAHDQPVTVTVQTVDGTATSGSDYTAVSRIVTIPTGFTVAHVSVSVVDDTTHEADESFELQLSNPSRSTLSANPRAEATINDDDPWVVQDLTVGCVATGSGPRLDIDWDPPAGDVGVDRYEAQIHTGGAEPSRSFFALSFPVDRRVAWNTNIEAWRANWSGYTYAQGSWPNNYGSFDWGGTHTVRMRPVGSGTSGDWSHATATCPTPPVTVDFGQASYTVAEGSSEAMTMTLSADPQRTVVVPISATNQGGATSADYSVPASVTFNSGETSKTITFTATDDTDHDDGEWVELTFGTLPSRVTAGITSTATVSINDDDTTSPPNFLR